ncbi:MAG: S9 family peptidase [Anaerolineae bacterium]
MTERTLIPRRVLFGNPDKAMPKLSPDGKHLAFIAPLNKVMNIWLAPHGDMNAAKPITHDTKRNVRFYAWAYTNRHVLYIQDKAGDENWHVYVTDVESGETRDLTPIEGVNAQVIDVNHMFPETVWVGLNDRQAQLHDLHEVNLLTGERKLIEHNPGFVSWLVDESRTVRYGITMQPNGDMIFLKRVGGEWQPEPNLTIPHEDNTTSEAYGFDKSGKIIYLADSRNRNTAALMTYHTESGKLELIAEDPRADLENALFHPTERTPQAALFHYDRRRWQVIDSSLAADFEYLQNLREGDLGIENRTLDDQVWLVSYTVADGPVAFYRYDRHAKQATYLFNNRPDLEGLPLSKMHPVIIPARDGLPLVSYLTLPHGSDTKQAGLPDAPLPMVLFVHGGPWARDSWMYSPFHQLLANRGYAVLSVNYRGSTGFGKLFVNAADLQWGKKMHDDLIDAVEWAINHKITTRSQVAIMGGSYGGYATLAGLTLTPDVFACGVDIVGPSSLITLVESVPPYWEPMIALFRKRMGDNTTEAGRELLLSVSPLTHVDKIRRPLLIAQGANDPRVKQHESDQIVKAMQEKNIPVTYALYPDEGHGFAREENWISFMALTESFLATHLEGEHEPIGDAFNGSSVQIVTGIEGVPGAAEAIQ